MSAEVTTRRPRRWLILPPVAIGLGLLAWAAASRDQAARAPVAERARAVTIVAAPRVDVVPRVTGYGTSAPARRWRAVAEVRGRVVSVHPELAAGALLPAGAEVVRLDATEYELAVARLRADMRRMEAQLAELARSGENVTAALEIERASLALAETDAKRLTDLASTGAVTDTEVDTARRAVLAQRQAIQSLESQSAVLPAQRDALQASLASTAAALKQAELDVARTVLTTPFACRIAVVSLEVGQFVAASEALFEAHGTDMAEVEARIPLARFRPLVQRSLGDSDVRTFDMETLRERLALDATVTIVGGALNPRWKARFLRIRESIDEVTRAGGFVVGVEDPYGQAVPGERPPLMAGAYCRVDLAGPPLPDRVIVPRTALSGSSVHVADADSRLAVREIVIEFEQGGFAVVADGVAEGERVLVTPVSPAIEGMLLECVADDTARDALAAEAAPSRDAR